MSPPHPERRLSSRAVHLGMVSVLSLVVAACTSDSEPSTLTTAPLTPTEPTFPPTPSPTDTDDEDEDDKITAYCVRGPKGRIPDDDDEEPAKGYHVVNDDLCDEDELGKNSTPSASVTPARYSYFWYYGGHYRAGRVSGGSLKAPFGDMITTRSGATARGGFGGGLPGGG